MSDFSLKSDVYINSTAYHSMENDVRRPSGERFIGTTQALITRENTDFSVVLEEKERASSFSETGIFVSKNIDVNENNVEVPGDWNGVEELKSSSERVQFSYTQSNENTHKGLGGKFEENMPWGNAKVASTSREKVQRINKSKLGVTNPVLKERGSRTMKQKATSTNADRNNELRSYKEVAARYIALKDMKNFIKVSIAAVAGGMKVSVRVGEIEIEERNEIAYNVNSVVREHNLQVLSVDFDNHQFKNLI